MRASICIDPPKLGQEKNTTTMYRFLTFAFVVLCTGLFAQYKPAETISFSSAPQLQETFTIPSWKTSTSLVTLSTPKNSGAEITGQLLGGIGGFLVGWTLGTALGGGDPDWTVAGVGAGFIALSIPFAIKVKKL